jgi:alpha-methylacyl-CoA racemase
MTSSSPPLAGVRVIELAGVGPSRHCGLLLAQLGADVVLVQRPGEAPRRADSVMACGRRVIAVDLKTTDGRDTILALAQDADILIDPYRPGVTERLGIGPEPCLERNPRLIYGRMTGWGQRGPLALTAGHDICYIAITGVLHAMGRAGGPPQVPMNLLGDFAGGAMYLLIGLLAGLWHRDHVGQGMVIDAAIVDGTLSLASFIFGLRGEGQWSDERGVNVLDTGAPYYDVYQTADAKWVAVGAIEPQFFAALLHGLAINEAPPQDDRTRWPELRALLAAAFSRHTRDHWASVFADTDACVAPVLTFAEAARHPHVTARGALRDVDGVLVPAAAPRLSTAIPSSPPPPLLTPASAVLAEWARHRGPSG